MFEEFKNITNSEAYKKAFQDRMLLRDPSDPYKLLGNTQRDDFIPHLEKLIASLPPKPHIFDVGAGSGEIVDLVLSKLDSAEITIEEPNSILLDQYRKRLKAHSNLQLVVAIHKSIQDLYSHHDIVQSQDLVLAIHMIYYLSDFRSDKLAPNDDILNFVSFLYNLLSPNGTIFLVYAYQQMSTGGKAAKHYFLQKDKLAYKNLDAIWSARENLLHMADVKQLLDARYSQSSARIESRITHSYLYGKNLEDIAIMCIAGELGCADDEPFDATILDVCFRFVDEHADDIGLCVEERDCPQKGMYRCNQPQIICTITRG
ncbi:MAG: class I SAM-dependent methyltransferase [Deltaproteobacteria bacterium]|nr:class I SAM-dependent methyltransferase [Deltaproteobacteria bacterium]